MVALYRIVRFDSVVTLSDAPAGASSAPAPPQNPPYASISRGFLKIEWAAGRECEYMQHSRTLRAVLEGSEQKSRKVYCSCKEVANGSHNGYVSRLDAETKADATCCVLVPSY